MVGKDEQRIGGICLARDLVNSISLLCLFIFRVVRDIQENIHGI